MRMPASGDADSPMAKRGCRPRSSSITRSRGAARSSPGSSRRSPSRRWRGQSRSRSSSGLPVARPRITKPRRLARRPVLATESTHICSAGRSRTLRRITRTYDARRDTLLAIHRASRAARAGEQPQSKKRSMSQRSANTRMPPRESPYSTAASSAAQPRRLERVAERLHRAVAAARRNDRADGRRRTSAATSSDRQAHSTASPRGRNGGLSRTNTRRAMSCSRQEAGGAPERLERHPLVQPREHVRVRRLEADRHLELRPAISIAKTQAALAVGARRETPDATRRSRARTRRRRRRSPRHRREESRAGRRSCRRCTA